MRRPLSLVLLVSFLAVASNVALCQEWSRFRGPNGDGQSDVTTIPTSFTSADLLWKVGLPGVGNSSPVIWGDRLFLLSGDPDSGARHVLCLNIHDGRQLWQRDYPATTHRIHLQNTLASSTPVADSQHVYCAWATPEEFTMVALTHDGKEAWRASLGPFASAHGFATSPIVYEDLVIVTNDQDGDSSLIALDSRSGKIRWQVPRKVRPEQNASYAAPCILQQGGKPDQLIVCGWSHGMTSLDPKSGTVNWELPVFERRPVGSPILVDGLILGNCGEGSGNNDVVAVRPPTADDPQPKQVYKIGKTSAPYVPTLIAKSSLVFLWGDKGGGSCIDAPTGKVHWRERVGGNFYGSPVRAGDSVFCVSVEGDVVALAAEATYKLLGRSPLGETCRATPAIAAGRMFVRTESHLVAVGKP